MVSNFVLPITPSAFVTHAFNTHMRDLTQDELVMIKSGFLQMYLCNELNEFQCYQSIKLKGNVKDACLFRPPNAMRDVVLVLTNETTLTAYGYSLGRLYVEGCGTAGNVLECGTEIFSHQGKFVVAHPDGVILLRVRSHYFTIVMWSQLKRSKSYAVLPIRDIPSSDNIILQMEFLQCEDKNVFQIAYINEEDYGRQLRFFSLCIKNFTLTEIGPNVPLLDDVMCLIPLAAPYGGILIKMRDRLIHFQVNGGPTSELKLKDPKFTTVICWTRTDQRERIILCDYYGNLYNLTFCGTGVDDSIEMEAKRMGSVKAAYTMCVISDRFIFFGSKFNDSVLAHYIKDKSDRSILEFQVFPHLGGISHLSIVDDGKHRSLLGLNTNDEPTLRLCKNIKQFRVHYILEENPQNGLFSFGHDCCLKNHIVTTFGTETVLLQIGQHSRTVTFCEFIETKLATVVAGSFHTSGCVYQITTKEIRVFHPLKGVIAWQPPNQTIDVATVNRHTNQILVSCRNHLYYLLLQDNDERFRIVLRRSREFTDEITCLDIPHDFLSSRLFAVGFWSSKQIGVFRMSTFDRIATHVLTNSYPRSVAVNKYHDRYYLFGGTAEGVFLHGTVNLRTGNVDNMRETNLGWQPVLFLRPDMNYPQYIYALSDRTVLVDDRNDSVNFVEVDLSELTAFCYLKTDQRRIYAIASSSIGTQVGFMDETSSFKIKDFKLNSYHPYDMCYEPESKRVGLLCRKRTKRKRTVIVNPDVEDEMQTYDAYDQPREDDNDPIKTYFVALSGRDFSKQEEYELDFSEYASAITCGKFTSDYRSYFVLATLQFSSEAGQRYQDITNAIERDREKWLTNRLLLVSIDPKSKKTITAISCPTSHGMIRSVGILGNSLIAALKHKIVAYKFNGRGPLPITSVAEYLADGPLVMKIRGDRILITEPKKAYILAYDETTQTFETITKDERCHRISAAEFITDDFIIGADKYNEIVWGNTGMDGVYSSRCFGQRKSCYVRERIGAFAVGNLNLERSYALNKLRYPIIYTTWRGGIGVIAEVPCLTLKMIRDLIEMLSITKTPYVALERSNTGMFMTNRFVEGNFLRTFLNWQEDQLLQILADHKVERERLPNCLRLIQDTKKLIMDLENYS